MMHPAEVLCIPAMPTLLNQFVSTTYYIQETIESPIEEVGPPDNTFGSGGYFNSNDLRGIFFNVEVPLTIETVKVYSNMAGNRTIQVLAGEGGPVVHSLTMNIPSGEQVIDLNFAMEPGDQYYIKVTGARVDLFRINDGSPDYPYEIPGVISLTGSNVVGAELDYYYYFSTGRSDRQNASANWHLLQPVYPLYQISPPSVM